MDAPYTINIAIHIGADTDSRVLLAIDELLALIASSEALVKSEAPEVNPASYQVTYGDIAHYIEWSTANKSLSTAARTARARGLFWRLFGLHELDVYHLVCGQLRQGCLCPGIEVEQSEWRHNMFDVWPQRTRDWAFGLDSILAVTAVDIRFGRQLKVRRNFFTLQDYLRQRFIAD